MTRVPLAPISTINEVCLPCANDDSMGVGAMNMALASNVSIINSVICNISFLLRFIADHDDDDDDDDDVTAAVQLVLPSFSERMEWVIPGDTTKKG